MLKEANIIKKTPESIDKILEDKKRANSDRIKEFFRKHLEFSWIGTPEEYQEYLENIFPDTKVKHVVYHGTTADKFDKFDRRFTGIGSENNTNTNLGFYAIDSEFAAAEFASTIGVSELKEKLSKLYKTDRDNHSHIINQIKRKIEPLSTKLNYFGNTITTYGLKESRVIPLLVNLRRPYIMSALDFSNTFPRVAQDERLKMIKKIKIESKNCDGIIVLSDAIGSPELQQENYIVFDEENIHILGNEKDLKGFEKWKQSNV